MRKIEARRLWLPGNSSMSMDEMIRLSFVFMDYAMHSRDYRFLNTALKINDRLRKERKIADNMEIEGRERDCLEILKKRLGLMR
uniref:Uncharacterized protein n=1 Tax=Candidatus Kentrum sp. MB TaxID=2138164 RepID=A0A450XP27_9GAMM|nr:MAG: hypothetical protein BECKMB1821I_GA0114274_101927 [Candidatus Kentron sp. MB]VFK30959.1 MAG: hypothetical protein BECKMB1821G_GA0114241_10742 [Candidatus Kentron sp. MB]VFK76803.1 MAG: hypothetical protein BECKMB1821H_GA0114242_10762 [Candidatus Kentron sp. MB]